MWSRPGKLSQGVGGAPSAISLQDATVESSSWPARNTRALALMFAMYSNWVPDNALSMIDWGIQPLMSVSSSHWNRQRSGCPSTCLSAHLITNVCMLINWLDGFAFNKGGIPAGHRLYSVEQLLQQQPRGHFHIASQLENSFPIDLLHLNHITII